MGYACAAAADDVLQVLSETGIFTSQNSWTDKRKEYFFEIGKENEDGAITGSVWLMTGSKVGGFRIEPNGYISKFPHIPKKYKEEAMLQGAGLKV